MRRAALGGAIVVVLALSACAPDPGTRPATSIADGVAQSSGLIGRLLDDAGPGCSAAVARHGDVIWSGQRGMADVEAGLPIAPGTRFDLASVSKQFTAMAVLQLVQEGMVGLDDPLSSVVPRLPSWADRTTIDHLLHHSSGIPDYLDALLDEASIEERTTQQDAIEAIVASGLDFEPGERFEYSNSNYVLLAEVVEILREAPLADVLENAVFPGSGMRLEPASTADDVARPYVGGERVEPAWLQVGDGSVVAAPSELAEWADTYRTGGSVIDLMLDSPVDDGSGGGYAAGIIVAPDGALSHSGGWSGFVTLFGVTSDRSTSIVVSCNGDDAPAEVLARGLLTVWGETAFP